MDMEGAWTKLETPLPLPFTGVVVVLPLCGRDTGTVVDVLPDVPGCCALVFGGDKLNFDSYKLVRDFTLFN